MGHNSNQAWVAGQSDTASPSIGADTRSAAPSLATTGQAASSSNDAIARLITPPLTTARQTASPLLGSNPGSIAPAPSTGSHIIPSSPPRSRSRFPSPDAVELISALANYESLSDDALNDAALHAQQAMVKWQNEYMVFRSEISRMREPPRNSKKNRKTKPREFEEPKKNDQKHHDSPQQPTSNIVQMSGNKRGNTVRARAIDPISKPSYKGRNELHIDMTGLMQPVEGKRIRKPRLIDGTATAATAPQKTKKRAREPESHGANTPVEDQPAAKKQDTRTRQLMTPEGVRTARTTSKRLTYAPDDVSKKRSHTAQAIVEREKKEKRGRLP